MQALILALAVFTPYFKKNPWLVLLNMGKVTVQMHHLSGMILSETMVLFVWFKRIVIARI